MNAISYFSNHMKNNKIKCIIFSFFAFVLTNTNVYSRDTGSGFRHPLQIQAVGLYNKVNVQANAADLRGENEYTREQNARLEGEWRAFENVSFLANAGYTNLEQNVGGSYKGQDRFGLGIKSAWESENWVFGAGVLGFSRNPSQPKFENVNPDFYILRPYLGAGYKWGNFQIQGELHVQTETNSDFKEKFNEEFRRHYQAGVSFSYGFGDFVNAFLEVETRVPYDREIDRDSRYASVYPGISIPTEDFGTFAISAGFPIINDRVYDRSVRLQYFYFW